MRQLDVLTTNFRQNRFIRNLTGNINSGRKCLNELILILNSFDIFRDSFHIFELNIFFFRIWQIFLTSTSFKSTHELFFSIQNEFILCVYLKYFRWQHRTYSKNAQFDRLSYLHDYCLFIGTTAKRSTIIFEQVDFFSFPK